MNQITTLPKPDVNKAVTREILSLDGIVSSVIQLAPHENFSGDGASPDHQRMLFVINGEVTVRIGEVNTVLDQDKALVVPAKRDYSLATGEAEAKLLQVVIPLRQAVALPIHTFAP